MNKTYTYNMNTYKITAKEANCTNEYVRNYRSDTAVWTNWQRVCTTSVADVKWTQLTINSGMKGSICYRIKNGICYVSVDSLNSSTMSTKSQAITSGLPVPESTNVWYSLTANDNAQGCLLVKIDNTGKMINYIGINGALYYGSFSYPVSE